MTQSRNLRYITTAVIFVIGLWIAAGAAYLYRSDIFDWWRLRDYTPSAAVVALADDTTMNDDARRMFYAYHPSIEQSMVFNRHCPNSELTIVLGCYIEYDGIYIYKIDDERLQGVRQVTAAHELLHAAYDRLSANERETINTQLAKVYDQLQDQRVKDTIEQYRKSDPSSVPNELHSIIGTEVRDLPDELEDYYARYFTDRSKIVEYSDRYEAAFSTRKAEIGSLEKELKALKTQIEYANRDLESSKGYLEERGAIVRPRAQSGSATSQEISTYNQLVDSYNAKIASTNRLVDSYNVKRERYILLVGEQNDLFKKIDSRQSISG